MKTYIEHASEYFGQYSKDTGEFTRIEFNPHNLGHAVAKYSPQWANWLDCYSIQWHGLRRVTVGHGDNAVEYKLKPNGWMPYWL